MALDYIKKEFKKLGSMILIGAGSFLILEHIYTYGGIEFMDILGHEWFGIILIILGLFFANKKWMDEQKPLSYAWSKIKYVFGRK